MFLYPFLLYTKYTSKCQLDPGTSPNLAAGNTQLKDEKNRFCSTLTTFLALLLQHFPNLPAVHFSFHLFFYMLNLFQIWKSDV